MSVDDFDRKYWRKYTSRDWRDLLPPDFAWQQGTYEIRQVAVRMRDAGLTFVEIARRLGFSSPTAARKQVLKGMAAKGKPTPFERYVTDPTDMARIRLEAMLHR